MHDSARIPKWLLGGIAAWLAWCISLGVLHLHLLSQWGVPYSIHLYAPDLSTPTSLPHLLLLGMVSPAFFALQTFSALGIHLYWLDAIIYNWRLMVLLASGPAFVIGALVAIRNRLAFLAASVIAVLHLIAGILFILSTLHPG